MDHLIGGDVTHREIIWTNQMTALGGMYHLIGRDVTHSEIKQICRTGPDIHEML